MLLKIQGTSGAKSSPKPQKGFFPGRVVSRTLGMSDKIQKMLSNWAN